ncbi:MAG TPA: methyltransferase domain-containing protein [Candidatus Acidoferrales bacterium]|nr:methyltransferase domain-containing protein [Candidatus Acidoferrales bacterium]
MPGAGWNPDQYLKFSAERTQPCRDLVARIDVPQMRTAIDLGCGPGNSTQVLLERWPDAQITALDSDVGMIQAAIESHPHGRWIVGDINKWAGEKPAEKTSGTKSATTAQQTPADSAPESSSELYDLVFSNAALQWLHDHATLFPLLFSHVAPGGALAFQIPSALDRPAHRLLREMAASLAWRKWFHTGRVRSWHSQDSEFYYDLLAPLASRIDLWQTEYIHVLPNAEAVVEWYKGTGMRPYLTAITDDADRDKFLAEYREKIRAAYRPRPDGHILFPFLRLFFIAYR